MKLLTVTVDRLRQWYRPGLLCIGDAAHAMSPIGGVGINLAVQDAVAAANILAGPLSRGAVTVDTLKAVQQRREFPTRFTQRVQITLQNNLIGPALQGTGKRPHAPLLMKMMQWPLLRRIPGRVLALGRAARAHQDAGEAGLGGLRLVAQKCRICSNESDCRIGQDKDRSHGKRAGTRIDQSAGEVQTKSRDD